MGCLIPHASVSLSTLGRASVPSQVKRVAFLGVGTTVHHSQWASTGPRAQGHSWERGTVLLLGKKIKQRKICVTGGLGSPQERPEQGCVWEGKVCLLPKLRGMVWPLHRLPQHLPESWATEVAVSKGEFKCFKMLKEFSLPQTFFTSRVDRFM